IPTDNAVHWGPPQTFIRLCSVALWTSARRLLSCSFRAKGDIMVRGTSKSESQGMTKGVVFFSRCRPQGSDTVDLVLRELRVFIGYPAWRKNVMPRRGHLREAVIDFQCSDEDWAPLYASFGDERREYQKNRNFIRSVKPEAIALVPRPNRGVVYAGRVVVPFEVLDDPPWGDDYLRLRHAQGLDVEDEFSHLADVAQCCEVDRFRSISLLLIPAWIRRSLFGRSTYGLVTPLAALDLDGFVTLDRLLENPRFAERAWTDDVTEVERRLVDAIGPNAFEHLCVALLQLPSHVVMLNRCCMGPRVSGFLVSHNVTDSSTFG